MKVTWIQGQSQGSVEANFVYYQDTIKEAAKTGAQLVVLPELFFTDYFAIEERVENFAFAMKLDDPKIIALEKLSAELKIVLTLPIFEKRSTAIFHNSCLIVDNGKVVTHYRKMHIPDDPGFYEKYYFTPGDLGFMSAKTSIGNIGILICWDQWFPEAARLTALQGADIILYPTAIGWDSKEDPKVKDSQLEAWVTVMRGHAIANNVHVLAVNRVGQEGHLHFWGNSFCANPDGTVIARNDTDEAITSLEIDIAANAKRRILWPFMRDRRVDHYQNLQKVWND